MDPLDATPRRKPTTRGRRLRRLLLVNLVLFALVGGLGELGFRLLWNPKYWVTADEWLVGSGQSRAGKKWWPGATYQIRSREFRVTFRTNELGYRARPEPPRTADPYRIAFVGDSFTEAMQVEQDACFVAHLERGLAGALGDREVICENFGIAATAPFDYYHRIIHDVLRPGREPDALVLCLYPGNDFNVPIPDDGFDPDGRPHPDYFRPAGPVWHTLTWLNLKSKLAHYAIRSIAIAALPRPSHHQSPPLWWTDPARAATACDTPGVRRTRALLQAIEDECRSRGTRLVFLVVGPVAGYTVRDGRSPLGVILADWGLQAPVIDVAAWAALTPNWPSWLFPRDGHLNESGHAFTARAALGALRDALAAPPGRLASSRAAE